MNNKKTNQNHTSNLTRHTSNHDICTNPVGAYCIRPNSRGITLIALIITIIVMLILVAVTINVVLDTGLFGIAKEAGNKTKVEADRETLQGAVVASVNEDLQIPNATALQQNLEGWTVGGAGPYIVTSPNRNIFKVETNGTITYQGKSNSGDDVEEELQKYILGEEVDGERPGKDLFTIIGTTIDEDGVPVVELINKGNLNVEMLGMNLFYGDDMEIYIKYEGEAYKFSAYAENDEIYITQNLRKAEKIITDPKTELASCEKGYKFLTDATGDGKVEGWIVLYDAEDTSNGYVEIISSDIMGNLRLGSEDSWVEWENPEVKTEAKITDKDIEGIREEEANNEANVERVINFRKAVYSYNHAIDTINGYCGSLIKLAGVDVRTIGTARTGDTTNPYGDTTSYYTEKMYKEDVNTEESWFSTYNFSGIAKVGEEDSVFTEKADWKRIESLGIQGTSNSYWIPSRYIDAGSNYVKFNVRNVYNGGIRDGYYLFYARSSGGGGQRPFLQRSPNHKNRFIIRHLRKNVYKTTLVTMQGIEE